jgi:fructokinase
MTTAFSPRILCLGESAVDWIRTTSGAEFRRRVDEKIAHAGDSFARVSDGFFAEPGTPATNVAIALSRLGLHSSLLAAVGLDEAGAWLKSALAGEGVNIDQVVEVSAQTCQARVLLGDDGERKLVGLTNGKCADMELRSSDIDASLFNAANVLYLGSNSLSHNPIAGATKHALALARRKGMLVVADANMRAHLWSSPEACKQAVLANLSGVDVLKVNLDEFELLTGSRDVHRAKKLSEELGVGVVLVTLGAMGAFFFAHGESGFVAAPDVDVKDSSGAGDAFTAMVICQIVNSAKSGETLVRAVDRLSSADWTAIVRRANAAGALTVSRLGASSALPSSLEVDAFLSASRKAG